MFYLISFWKTIVQSSVKGLAFCLLTLVLLLSIFSRENIEQKLLGKISISGQESFFYALIDDKENQPRVARKLRSLPGVKRVDLLSSNSISTKATEVVKSIGLGIESQLLNLNYSGLKITFAKEVSKRSITLIRDYLSRLVGKDKLTMGGVKEPDLKNVKLSGVLNFFKGWGTRLFITVLFCVWLIVFFGFEENLKQESYLIESYQRRQHVSLKMLLAGMASICVLAFAISFLFFNTPNAISLIIAFFIMSFVVLLQVRTKQWAA